MMLDASFPGQYYPPSTIVSFPTKNGTLTGQVQKLLKRKARVIVDDDEHESSWKVPYHLMTVIEQVITPEITLEEVRDFAEEALKELGLDDWKFGFDLAQIRGGVCYHNRKHISLSVSYCCFASRDQVLDTVLHEIAHAIAGHAAGHGHKWKEVAELLGCKPEACHTVRHGLDMWEGVCPCGQKWERMRLEKRSRDRGICLDCNGTIKWRRIISKTWIPKESG